MSRIRKVQITMTVLSDEKMRSKNVATGGSGLALKPRTMMQEVSARNQIARARNN